MFMGVDNSNLKQLSVVSYMGALSDSQGCLNAERSGALSGGEAKAREAINQDFPEMD